MLFLESNITELFITAIIILVCLYWHFTNTFNHWSNKGVKFIKPIPIFGNTKEVILRRQFHSIHAIPLYKEFKPYKYGGYFSGRKPILMVCDPEMIKQFLVKDFSYFNDRSVNDEEKQNPLSLHLFNLGGIRWRLLRTKLSPTFTSGKMKMMFHIIRDCTDVLSDHLEESIDKNEPIDVKEAMASFTTDVIGTCAFGLKFNALKNPDSEFRKIGRELFSPSAVMKIKIFFRFVMPELRQFFNLTFPGRDVVQSFIRIAKETVDYRIKNKIKRNDFMQMMISLKENGKVDDDDEPVQNGHKEQNGNCTKKPYELEVDEKFIAAQTFVFFVAGFDTSSTALTFSLYELALNPDIQKKLQNEIDRVLETTNGEITYDVVMSMKYLDQVLCETLRKYPSLPVLDRVCTRPYTIPGTDIKMDVQDTIRIPMYAIHHDEEYFPDPERFDPERFTEEGKASRPPFTYLPFGEGPRICIGMRFGQMQVKTGLTALLSKYDVHTCEETPKSITFGQGLLTNFKEKMMLKLTRRSKTVCE